MIQIGEFYIREKSNGNFWIERQGSEGMEVKLAVLIKILSTFWDIYF